MYLTEGHVLTVNKWIATLKQKENKDKKGTCIEKVGGQKESKYKTMISMPIKTSINKAEKGPKDTNKKIFTSKETNLVLKLPIAFSPIVLGINITETILTVDDIVENNTEILQEIHRRSFSNQ